MSGLDELRKRMEQGTQPTEAGAAVSAAISLKRIADALDSPSPKGSVLYFLEQIASAANAGRQP